MSTDDQTNEPAARHSIADQAAPQQYEIRVGGHLGSRWSTWFDGLALSCENDGTSVIRGFVIDQAALHGLLQKLRDLGITLISVNSASLEAAIEHPNETRNQSQHHGPGETTS